MIAKFAKFLFLPCYFKFLLDFVIILENKCSIICNYSEKMNKNEVR